MNYLISGANGFVGQELTKLLLSRGENVSALIRKGSIEDFSEKFPTVKIKELKERFLKEEIVELLNETDVFFLLSGMKGVKSNNLSVRESIDINILYPKKVLEASLKSPVKKIVFLSSEKAFLKSGVYGASKYIIEKLFSQYNKLNQNCKYIVVRCGNIAYSKNSLMSIWRENLVLDKEVIISDKSATKFLCSVSSCVDFLIESLNSSEELFIPKMKSVSLGELLQEMILAFNPNFSKIKEAGLFEEEEMSESLAENLNSRDSEKLTKEELRKIIYEK